MVYKGVVAGVLAAYGLLAVPAFGQGLLPKEDSHAAQAPRSHMAVDLGALLREAPRHLKAALNNCKGGTRVASSLVGSDGPQQSRYSPSGYYCIMKGGNIKGITNTWTPVMQRIDAKTGKPTYMANTVIAFPAAGTHVIVVGVPGGKDYRWEVMKILDPTKPITGI